MNKPATKQYAKYHAIRINHEAFCKLHAKEHEEMLKGDRVSLGDIASKIIINA